MQVSNSQWTDRSNTVVVYYRTEVRRLFAHVINTSIDKLPYGFYIIGGHASTHPASDGLPSGHYLD